MINKTYLQRLLNVRASEWNLVTKLFWLQFFQGTGIAFFFTASFSSFLEHIDAKELASVMILSSPLLFITGWLFNKFEHKWNLSKLGTATILGMAASIFLFLIADQYITAKWFYYLMFAWYYVLYLASSLCFWSITSTLFDVRQSKRLFSVISAGDIPAKFIGYTVAYLFVKTVGANNLLWPSVFFMLCSLPSLFRLSKMGVIVHHHQHHDAGEIHHEFKESISGKKLLAILKRFTMNALIRRIAILTFLISSGLAIINYAFYTEVKGNHHDKSLSNFILLFMAGSQVIALLVKLIFTSRITTGLGIKKSLLITPLVLITLLAFIYTAELFISDHEIILYAFGGAAISIEVLRTAINAPVFLSVMQPLNHAERSKAHAIVKGIMDPFAYLFSGALILLLNNLPFAFDLKNIIIVLIIITIAWIILIVLVDKSYRHILLKTISSRFFSQDEFSLSDEELQKQIKNKIDTGNELEVINILQMLNSHLSNESRDLIFTLLDNPSDNVKKETILLIGNRKLKGADKQLKSLATNSTHREVQWLSVQALCREENSHAHQKHFLHQHDNYLKTAAISGMILSGDQQAIKQAEEILSTLINSDDAADKLSAISALNSVKDIYTHPMHQNLFNDTNEIKTWAISAVGKSASSELLQSMVKMISGEDRRILDTLQACGEKSIPVIRSNIFSPGISKIQTGKLINLTGIIGGTQSHVVLLELLEKNKNNTAITLKALNRSHYNCTAETRKLFETISMQYILFGVELLSMQKYLLASKNNFKELVHAINLELNEIKNALLDIFSCLYDHKKIFKIKQGLEMKNKESVANAMEAIEMTVKMELASKFNLLFEPADIEHKYYMLKSLIPEDVLHKAQDIMERILKEKPIEYTAWTKATTLYISKKYNLKISSQLIKKFTESENMMLRETAQYAL